MSDEVLTNEVPGVDPAIAMIEFSSIAVGIVAGDAMIKASPLGSIYAGTVHPGKYLVLVSGDTASVDEAFDVGLSVGRGMVLDSVFLPDIHPAVTGAIASDEEAAWISGDALGMVETEHVATVIQAADAGVKAAFVEVSAVRMADGLGGKGYVLFSGEVAEVEAAVDAAEQWSAESGFVLQAHVIAQLHDEMAFNLRSDLRFRSRLALRPLERDG
ncbi:MAG: BMC domain-containing protein [Acidimicrobiia bacterium]|nr:BMC domain-containing protein [Acidimicrobiia bacterium]